MPRFVEDHRQKIYEWLAAPDHKQKHEQARSLRHAMTGLWFVEETHFQEWRGAPHSFLWLHGIRESAKLDCSAFD